MGIHRKVREAPIDEKIRAVTPNDWHHVEMLFGSKGACGGCWCMYWRVQRGGQTWDAVRGNPAKQMLRQLIKKGEVHALLAFHEGRPVGWLCAGPPTDFPRLSTVKALRHERLSETWAIVCLYLLPVVRRQGLGTRLIQAACDYAFTHGARVLEGYPVNVRSGSTMPGAFAWTGVPPMFENAGFKHVNPESEARGIWRMIKR